MVDPVVMEAACADGEHRLCKSRRACPFEPHTRVARHIDEQATGAKAVGLVLGDEHERVVGVLKHAVDDDVVIGENVANWKGTSACGRQGSASVLF